MITVAATIDYTVSQIGTFAAPLLFLVDHFGLIYDTITCDHSGNRDRKNATVIRVPELETVPWTPMNYDIFSYVTINKCLKRSIFCYIRYLKMDTLALF